MVKLFSEALGREVEVPDEPERIVSLSPAITEILYRIGLEDRVVGVSFYCNKPPRAREKPRVGSYYKVLYDKVEELEPDLVLTTTGAQRKVLEELASRFTVYPVPLPVTIHGIIDEIKVVGIITGRIREARRLAGESARILGKLEGKLAGVRLYYEIFLGGPVSAGAHSYIEDLFSHLGAETPFSSTRTTWVINPSPEAVKAFNPQVVLYERSPYAEITREKIVKSMEERGLAGLEALREGRLIILEPDTLAHYGPSIFEDTQRIVQDVRRLLS